MPELVTPAESLRVFTLAGLGFLWGSFLGVLIHRGPVIWGLVGEQEDGRQLSLAWPPSHCPACGTQIALPDLIPLVGYFIARGKCRSCSTPIPTFYPLVEALGLLSGLLAALLFEGWLAGGTALVFFLLLIALAVIDQRTSYLPDALTLPLMTLGLLAGAVGLFVSAENAILGWVIGWGALAGLAAIYRMVRAREGLGGGDAKLLGAGAAFTGPMVLPMILLIAAGTALLAVLVAGKGRVAADYEIRFGPWLAGAIAAIFVTQAAFPGLLP